MEHDVDPTTGLTAEQIAEGKATETNRPSEAFNVFVPRQRSEVSSPEEHLRTLGHLIESRVIREEKRMVAWSVESFVVETVEPTCSLLHSSLTTARLIAMKRQTIGGVPFTFDIASALLTAPVVEPSVVDPPQEWLEEWIKNGGDPDVCWEAMVQPAPAGRNKDNQEVRGGGKGEL